MENYLSCTHIIRICSSVVCTYKTRLALFKTLHWNSVCVVDFFSSECRENAEEECSEFRVEVPLSEEFNSTAFGYFCRYSWSLIIIWWLQKRHWRSTEWIYQPWCNIGGGIFTYEFVANLSPSLPAKEFTKPVNIWGSYWARVSVWFYTSIVQCTVNKPVLNDEKLFWRRNL